MYNDYYKSPLGLVEIKASETGITQIIFCGDETSPTHSGPLTTKCIAQLDRYFAGELTTFDLPLEWKGTPFQENVWEVLTQIPYGQTLSYLDVAQKIDNPKAVRAVGGANSRNPISIVVPCHRVVGKNASLTGYAGGVARKKWLLQHEDPRRPLFGAQDLDLSDTIHLRQEKTQYLL